MVPKGRKNMLDDDMLRKSGVISKHCAKSSVANTKSATNTLPCFAEWVRLRDFKGSVLQLYEKKVRKLRPFIRK
jgi:hypothetical protein